MKVGLKEGFWADLWATHPPMYKRISILTQMAYKAGTSTPARVCS